MYVPGALLNQPFPFPPRARPAWLACVPPALSLLPARPPARGPSLPLPLLFDSPPGSFFLCFGLLPAPSRPPSPPSSRDTAPSCTPTAAACLRLLLARLRHPCCCLLLTVCCLRSGGAGSFARRAPIPLPSCFACFGCLRRGSLPACPISARRRLSPWFVRPDQSWRPRQARVVLGERQLRLQLLREGLNSSSSCAGLLVLACIWRRRGRRRRRRRPSSPLLSPARAHAVCK